MLHIRERRPNSQLLGIFVDDQRDPKERMTILAEQGEILKNDGSVYLVLERGSVQRHETGKRDPDDRAVRKLRVRPVAPRGRPEERQVLDARALSLGTGQSDARTIRCSRTSRARSAPNFTTASPRRSTRSPSCS